MALGRLQVLQHEALIDALKLLPDANLPTRQVDIVPSEAGRFSESQTASQGNREQGSESMLLGNLQERHRLFNGERPDRSGLGLRHLDQRRSVDADKLQPLRLRECRPERRVRQCDPPAGAVLRLVLRQRSRRFVTSSRRILHSLWTSISRATSSNSHTGFGQRAGARSPAVSAGASSEVNQSFAFGGFSVTYCGGALGSSFSSVHTWPQRSHR
jgi:hypothetical protein